MVHYIISQNSITVLLDGIPKVVDTTHVNYTQVLEAIKRGADEEELLNLINISKAIEVYSNGTVEVKDGVVLYKGKELHNYVVDKLFDLMESGFNINPLINFLSNLMENPSYRAVKELYQFLEKGGIPITEDGHFVVYKKVRPNYKDIYTGTIDNSVGAKPSMPRNMVNENSQVTCSDGLHVCSYSYLKHFGSCSGNRIMACKVNPRDVVSIPADYNDTKMRVCDYEIIEDVTDKASNFDVLRDIKVYKQSKVEIPKEGKAVMLVTNEKGKNVKVVYASAAEAETKTGIFATNITKVCKGIRTKAGGCTWQYA
jgi:hypothetical protein